MSRFPSSLRAIALLGAALVAPSIANAITECTTGIARIWPDSGSIWLTLTNNGSYYLLPTDPNLKNVLAMSAVALATGRMVTVRYQADAVACSAGARSDLVGMCTNAN